MDLTLPESHQRPLHAAESKPPATQLKVYVSHITLSITAGGVFCSASCQRGLPKPPELNEQRMCRRPAFTCIFLVSPSMQFSLVGARHVSLCDPRSAHFRP